MKYETIKRWVNDVFTDDSGVTIDPVRVGAIGGSIYAFICHIHSIFWLHIPFDMLTYSAGLSAILATLGMYLKMNKQHPEKKDGV